MARQGKLVFLRDLHAGMPASDRRQESDGLERVFPEPAEVILLHGDVMDGGLCEAAAAKSDPSVMAFVRDVRDRLGFFLEMIDRCDILYFDKVGTRLVFLVCAHVEEHLPLIRNAIAGEHDLLAALGIEPRDVDIDGGVIRIGIPAPDAGAALS